MAKIYSFTEEEKEIINFLKNIVTVKYGSYKNFKLKKEKYIIQKRIYKTVVLYASLSFNENTVDAYLLKNQDIIYKLAYHCFYPKKAEMLHNKILYLGRLYDFKLSIVVNGDKISRSFSLIIPAPQLPQQLLNTPVFTAFTSSFIFSAHI